VVFLPLIILLVFVYSMYSAIVLYRTSNFFASRRLELKNEALILPICSQRSLDTPSIVGQDRDTVSLFIGFIFAFFYELFLSHFRLLGKPTVRVELNNQPEIDVSSETSRVVLETMHEYKGLSLPFRNRRGLIVSKVLRQAYIS